MTQDATQPGVSPEQRKLTRQLRYETARAGLADAERELTGAECVNAHEELEDLKSAVLAFANALGEKDKAADGYAVLNTAWGNLLGLCNIVPVPESVTDAPPANAANMCDRPGVHVWSVDEAASLKGEVMRAEKDAWQAVVDDIDRAILAAMTEQAPLNPVHDYNPRVNWGEAPPGSIEWWEAHDRASSKMLHLIQAGWWTR